MFVVCTPGGVSVVRPCRFPKSQKQGRTRSIYSLGNKVTVKGQNFYEAMIKRGGLFQYLRRHRATIVMDNCPAHNKARAVAQERGYSWLRWPARSPDLNPIENIWSIMDGIKDQIQPKNRQQLLSSIHASYEKLQTEYKTKFENTLKSFKKRCRIVVEKEGAHCGY